MNATLRAAGIFLVTFAITPIAAAGTLTMGAPVIQGDQVTIPVMLDGSAGEGVASLDFRLRYDASILEPLTVRTGQAAAAADKQVHANSPQPGEYAVLMMGLNTNTVQSGEVASIVMQRVDNGATGRTHLTITRTTLSSAQGAEIPSSGSRQTLELGEPGETSEQPGEQPDSRDPAETPEPAATDGSDRADSAVTPERPAERSAGGAGTSPAMGSNTAPRPGAAEAKPGVPLAGQAPGGDTVQTARLSPRQALQQAQKLRPELPTPGAAGAEGAEGAAKNQASGAQAPAGAGTPGGEGVVPAPGGGGIQTTAPAPGGAPIPDGTRLADAAQTGAGPAESAAESAQVPGAVAAEAPAQGSVLKYVVMGAFVVVILGFFALRQKLFS